MVIERLRRKDERKCVCWMVVRLFGCSAHYYYYIIAGKKIYAYILFILLKWHFWPNEKKGRRRGRRRRVRESETIMLHRSTHTHTHTQINKEDARKHGSPAHHSLYYFCTFGGGGSTRHLPSALCLTPQRRLSHLLCTAPFSIRNMTFGHCPKG